MVNILLNDVKILKSDVVANQFALLFNANKSDAIFTSSGLDMTFRINKERFKETLSVISNSFNVNDIVEYGLTITVNGSDDKKSVILKIQLPFKYFSQSYFNDESELEVLNEHTLSIKNDMHSNSESERIPLVVFKQISAALEKNGIRMDKRQLHIMNTETRGQNKTYKCLLVEKETLKEEIKRVTFCEDGIILIFN